VYVNDLATGGHSNDNVPYLLVGNAGGALKSGLYVDAGDVPNKVFTTNNKILNTIGAVVGCKNAAGNPLDDFGDPTLDKGMIDAIFAAG
ncbi:MAG TPA: transcriptional initiation protein Tat, partial [Polyangia bacterium]|nr:transcriptional initiation protein Tat [Polyangia bacterium]